MGSPLQVLTTIESEPLVAVAAVPSVTLAVKVEVPAVGALPAITPVPGVKVAQAGRLPEAIDHVYGAVPPLAESVVL
jgi:hypothetical protein